MGLFKKLADDLVSDITGDFSTKAKRASLVASNLSVATDTIASTIAGVTKRIITDPIGTAEMVVKDTEVAIFGHTGPHIGRDVASFIQGLPHLAEDAALNVFNALPSTKPTPVYQRQSDAISAAANTAITSKFSTGASLGDLSWLIYKGRMVSNSEITDKWKLYREAETSHGFNSRVYVDGANKQVAITLEGTQANSDLSPLWLSKDGLADLEIGLGVIPPQMREGYEQFKALVADVVNKFGADYGISVAGHSLGGGLAQMMPGMYFIDTGVALPTLAEAGPGMLRQLKLYAEEQLLAGNEIHLPSGGTTRLYSLTTLGRANEAKAIVGSFKANDFSNITNMITMGDPVGAINYNADPDKDGHIGVSIIAPYLLTTREDMQDLESVAMRPVDQLGITTPDLSSPLGILNGLSNIGITRFDRHEPDQSIVLWSGTAVGFKDTSIVGVGSAVYRSYLEPREVWSGSKLGISEVKMFGSSQNDTLQTTDKSTMVVAGDGDDTIYGGNGGNILSGGNGNDFIFGGAGDDYLAGDAGDDVLYGGAGNDILYGGAGNDVLDGGIGDDLLFGGAGNDTLLWSAGNEILCGNEGDDKYIINEGVVGKGSIKWERNYTNFGNDEVVFKGAMAAGSSILMNFADEIRFQDMDWSVNGNDIVMTDSLGNQKASVTFKDAFTTFGENTGKIDFQFTNGKLYVDDVQYAVSAGSGDVKANEDSRYKGTIMVGSAGNDTLYSGKGNDLMFGGKGSDTFALGNTFGADKIIGSDASDKVKFANAFNAAEYTLALGGKDLVISYQQAGTNAVNTLTIADWATSGDKVNNFQFSDGSYSVVTSNSGVSSFVKK